MREYGTNVVAGCTPGKGGREVEGVAVYDTVAGAIDAVGEVDVSVVFVPAPLVKAAAIEAVEAGVGLLANADKDSTILGSSLAIRWPLSIAISLRHSGISLKFSK